MGDDGKPRQMWFSIPNEPVAFFAGLSRPTARGDAFAFATTSPNEIVSPWHPKAMPAILNPPDFTTWLDGSHDDALALVRPYDGAMTEQVATPADELIGRRSSAIDYADDQPKPERTYRTNPTVRHQSQRRIVGAAPRSPCRSRLADNTRRTRRTPVNGQGFLYQRQSCFIFHGKPPPTIDDSRTGSTQQPSRGTTWNGHKYTLSAQLNGLASTSTAWCKHRRFTRILLVTGGRVY